MRFDGCYDLKELLQTLGRAPAATESRIVGCPQLDGRRCPGNIAVQHVRQNQVLDAVSDTRWTPVPPSGNQQEGVNKASNSVLNDASGACSIGPGKRPKRWAASALQGSCTTPLSTPNDACKCLAPCWLVSYHWRDCKHHKAAHEATSRLSCPGPPCVPWRSGTLRHSQLLLQHQCCHGGKYTCNSW